MSRAGMFLLTLVTLLVAACAWWLASLEWVEQEIALGPTDEARRQPYLAAKRLLEAQGLEVVNAGGVGRLDIAAPAGPGSQDTLVLIDSFGTLSDSRAQALLAWVEVGGRLIVSAQNPYVSEHRLESDGLFEFFAVEVYRGADITGNQEQEPETFQQLLTPKSACAALIAPISFNFRDDQHRIQVAFPGWHTLQVDEEAEASTMADTIGVRLAQFQWGEGMVTFLSGTELWSNRYIACHDNAYMLWQLTMDSDKVWLMVNQEAPSLWRLLWQQAWLWVVAFGMTILLFLWRQSVRYGPVQNEHQVHRRNLLEHVDAAAAFAWRQLRGQPLLDNLRSDIETRLGSRSSYSAPVSAQSRADELSRLTGLAPDQIRFAMSGVATDEAGFTRMVQTLQHIRKQL